MFPVEEEVVLVLEVLGSIIDYHPHHEDEVLAKVNVILADILKQHPDASREKVKELAVKKILHDEYQFELRDLSTRTC